MRTAVLFLLIATAAPAAAQTRAVEIAASFTKTKNVSKTKHGEVKKKYREVHSSIWKVGSVREYAGHYISLGDPMELDVRIGASGAVTARGDDREPFEIENARIEDALLSGVKVYRNGRREPFEGAFMIRSDRASPDQPFVTMYGIGVPMDAPQSTGITADVHVFLRKQY